MIDNLNFRTKLLATAAVPANALVLLALWAAAVAGEPVIAAGAGAGAVVSLVVANATGARLARRADAVLATLPSTTSPSGDASDAGDAAGAGRRDELGRLQHRVDDLVQGQEAAVLAARTDVSDRMAGVLADLSVSVHGLVETQLDSVDWLEGTEEDPDRLAHLFTVDHVANRVRRACERAVVLARSEPLVVRDEPAPMPDVVRVALGELDDYRSAAVRSLDPALVAGSAARDLILVVAELVDNAVRHGEASEPPEVHGTLIDDGTYRITIVDQGPGMTEHDLDRANDAIASAAALDEAAGPAMGLVVVGRLARRQDLSVHLVSPRGAGVTAEIDVPAGLMTPVAAPVYDAELTSDSTGDRANGVERRASAGTWTPPEVTPLADDSLAVARHPSEPDDGAEDDAIDPSDAVEPVDPIGALRPTEHDDAIDALRPADDDDDAIDALRPAEDDDPIDEDDDTATDEAGPDVGTDLAAPADEDEDDDTAAVEDTTEPVAARGEATDGVPTFDESTAAPRGTLTRRRRGSSRPAAAQSSGPLARASSRKPDEVRSVITRYRDGLRGQRPDDDTDD